MLTPTDPEAFRERVLRRAVQLERRRRRRTNAMLALPTVVAVVLAVALVGADRSTESNVAANEGTGILTSDVIDVGGEPVSVVAGADGAMWVLVGGDEPAIVRIDGGDRTRVALPADARPQRLVAGTDQAVWATDPVGRRVLRAREDGSVETWPTSSRPSDTATWIDGRLWFAEPERDVLSGIASDGAVIAIDVPGGRAPDVVTTGPDGALWYASSTDPVIGSVRSGGAVNELALAGAGDRAVAMVTGPGSALWLLVASSAGTEIARVDSRGQVVGEPLPSPASTAMALGPDGRMWLANGDGTVHHRSLARVTVRTLGRPLRVDAWALAPDDTMWAVDRTAGMLVRIDLH